MGKTYRFLILLQFLLSTCTAAPRNATGTLPSVHHEDTPSRAVDTHVSETNPYTEIPDMENSEYSSRWVRIFDHDLEKYGTPLALANGRQGDLWFVYSKVLINYENAGTTTSYVINDVNSCAGCGGEINGTIAVDLDGNVWLGSSLGIVVNYKLGDRDFIPSSKIFTQNEYHGEVFVLLADDLGNVWISNKNNQLCSVSGSLWKCSYLDQLIRLNNIDKSDTLGQFTFAVTGSPGEVWVATNGDYELIRYQDDDFELFDLDHILPSEEVTQFSIGTMAYDDVTGSLWIADTFPPRCPEGALKESIGVISRTEDGEWHTYEKSVFFSGPRSTDQCWGKLTKLAVSPGGKVWMSMHLHHGLAYFDGRSWYTWDGLLLPAQVERAWTGWSVLDDVIVTNSGRIIVLGIDGIYEYLDAD